MTETNDGVTRFLPKYPHITKYRYNLFNPYDGDFYNAIYKKKEFYDLRLGKTEEFPDQPGILMNHQKIIARYLSTHTPYPGILLFHEMGTGKTCSSVAAIEQIRSEGKYRGAIYIASKVLSDNFLNELLYTCTDGRYIPEIPEKATALQKKMKLKRAVADYYKVGGDNTYIKFAKKVGQLKDQVLRKLFNNHIIVIDEVHNLADITIKEKNKGKNPQVYKSIHRFLHTVQGCKVILLSGTPMRNSVTEMASVMNLILPMDDQLPVGSKFIENYFNTKSEDLNLLTEKGKKKLRTVFKGRVSYLRAMTSDIKKVYKGKPVQSEGKTKSFRVYEDEMSAFQSEAYTIAWNIETKEKDKKGVYLGPRQASLFVFPNGSYGRAGFDKYIETKMKRGTHYLFAKRNKKRKSAGPQYSMGKELHRALNVGDKLETLSKYSSKYAMGIRIIRQAISENKLVFVYNEMIRGSGLILFSLILQLFGFRKVTGATKPTDTPTFALLTGETHNITKIIDIFNSAENKHGSRINVILGSKVIAEGISLKNVQVEIIQSPWFNYARIDQAIARGYRVGSHRALKAEGKSIELDIYQQVSIPRGGVESVELYMYRLSQSKDISIKGVERVVKESAFDCALTYQRNSIKGSDGSRECDYTVCDYECEGVPRKEYQTKEDKVREKDLDYSTYQLYYADKKTVSLIDEVKRMFKTVFIMGFEEIQEDLSSQSTEFELLTSLYTIISHNVPITNKYGFISYLREENDLYFLVDSLSVVGLSSMAYYTKYPEVKSRLDFSQIQQKYFMTVAIPRVIREICRSSQRNPIAHIKRLPINFQEMFIENALNLQVYQDRKTKRFTPRQQLLAKSIIKYYHSDIHELESDHGSRIVSTLLFNHKGPLRCLDVKPLRLVWKDCNPGETQLFENREITKRQNLEKSPFYGIINPKEKKFCIRDVRGGTDMKGHQLTSGAQCTSYPHHTLTYISTFFTDMAVPPEPATIEAIRTGFCGPELSITGKRKNFPKQITNSWEDRMTSIIGAEKKIRSKKLRSLSKNKAKMLRGFLKTSALRIKNNYRGVKHKRHPSYDKRWFNPGSGIFDKLVEMGKGKKTQSITQQWKALIRGIDAMTLPQMQRLIFYGSMMKPAICLFLCAWFDSNDLLTPNTNCGSGNKLKPKNELRGK